MLTELSSRAPGQALSVTLLRTVRKASCGLAWQVGYSRAGRRTLRPAQHQAWLTLIEFARIIVVIVALTSAVLKRAARK